jgi:hypothetical protein
MQVCNDDCSQKIAGPMSKFYARPKYRKFPTVETPLRPTPQWYNLANWCYIKQDLFLHSYRLIPSAPLSNVRQYYTAAVHTRYRLDRRVFSSPRASYYASHAAHTQIDITLVLYDDVRSLAMAAHRPSVRTLLRPAASLRTALQYRAERSLSTVCVRSSNATK